MYEFQRISLQEFESHPIRQQLPEQTIFQTPRWMHFLTATQKGVPVIMLVSDHGRLAGYFTGMMVSRIGMRILGSPFPGWSTGYMGFNLVDGANRRVILRELIEFAFRELGCMHLEIMDRDLSWTDLVGCNVGAGKEAGFEIDLECEEQGLMSRMAHQCRTNIRKAMKSSVVVEESSDLDFADDYYDQLIDVFAKRRLMPTFPRKRVQELVRIFAGQPGVLFLRARDQKGACVATTIVLGSNAFAYLWGAASYRESQSLRPNELLYWTAIRRAHEMGMKRFDMGGAGDYKRKYGGKPICVPWLRASRYQMFGALREVAEAGAGLKMQLLGKLNFRTQRNIA
jgi:hypothetical protein